MAAAVATEAIETKPALATIQITATGHATVVEAGLPVGTISSLAADVSETVSCQADTPGAAFVAVGAEGTVPFAAEEPLLTVFFGQTLLCLSGGFVPKRLSPQGLFFQKGPL